jgi:hypothetical protein
MTSEDVDPKPFFQMGDKVIQPSQQRPLGAFHNVLSQPDRRIHAFTHRRSQRLKLNFEDATPKLLMNDIPADD